MNISNALKTANVILDFKYIHNQGQNLHLPIFLFIEKLANNNYYVLDINYYKILHTNMI